VSATTFIGNRPDRATASATAVFCPRRGERLLEDLDLEGLAAEQTLELPDARLELAHPGGADHLVVDADRLAAACHPLPPLEQQARRETVRAGYERDRHARLQRLLNQPDLLRHRPAPAALLSADTFLVGALKGIGRVYLHAVVDTYGFGFLHVAKQPEAAVAVLHNEVLPFYRNQDRRPWDTIELFVRQEG
jgi:hypothetical protein